MLLFNRAEVKQAFAEAPVGVNTGQHSKKRGQRADS